MAMATASVVPSSSSSSSSSSTPPISTSSARSNSSNSSNSAGTKRIGTLVTINSNIKSVNRDGRLVRAGSDQGPYSPSSLSSPSSTSTVSSPSSPVSPLSPTSPRFRFSKLLHVHYHHHHQHQNHHSQSQQLPSLSKQRHHGSEQDRLQPQIQPSQQQLQQHQQHQHHNHNHPHHHHNNHRHHSGFFSSKHNGRGGFIGFLQSHYHAFHRTLDQKPPPTATSTFSADNAATGTGNMQRARNSSNNNNNGSKASFCHISPSTRNFLLPSQSLNGSSSSLATTNSSNSNRSPHTTVHSAYNVTISDFRAHATIASTRSAKLPTKITDVVFERRAFEGGSGHGVRGPSSKKSTAIATAIATTLVCTPTLVPVLSSSSSTDEVNAPDSVGMTSTTPTPNSSLASPPSTQRPTSESSTGGGFRSPLRPLAMLGLGSSSPSTKRASSTSSTSSSSNTLTSSVSTSRKQTTTISCNGNNDQISASSSSSKQHFAKGWEAATKKMGFMSPKKKQSLPSHYLSLPVGGTASSATNAMYMLHSEDLSVSEFAKLAGITILPDEETSSSSSLLYKESMINSSEGDDSTSSSLLESSRGCSSRTAVPPGSEPPESTGDTSTSDKSLTSETTTTNESSVRRTNIWDPQFWSTPNPERGVGGSHTSLSTQSLSNLPTTADATPPPPPSSPGTIVNDLAKQPYLAGGSASARSARPLSTSFIQKSGSSQEMQGVVFTKGAAHGRRNSYSPSGLLPKTGSRVEEAERMVLSRRLPDFIAARPTSDTFQLSGHIGRPRSFTSFTAVAIELEGGHIPWERSFVPVHLTGGQEQEQQQQQEQQPAQPHEQIDHVMSVMPLELSSPSNSSLQPQAVVAPILMTPHQHHVPVAALHALQQQSRPKSHHALGGHSRSPNHLRSGPSAASRTRSPSPSPLSRQIDISDSDGGRDSPLEEEDEVDDEDYGRSSSSRRPPSARCPPVSRNQLGRYRHGPEDNHACSHLTHDDDDSESISDNSVNQRQDQPSSHQQIGGLLIHNRTQSLPLALSDHTQPLTSSTPPPPPSSTPFNSGVPARPPTPRSYTPGTKVGRFTLVQELCTKHVDVLQAQEIQRRASLGDTSLFSTATVSGKTCPRDGVGWNGHIPMGVAGSTSLSLVTSLNSDETSGSESSSSEESATALGSGIRFKTDGTVPPLSLNPMLQPEDNVRVFMRKKAKRVMPVSSASSVSASSSSSSFAPGSSPDPPRGF